MENTLRDVGFIRLIKIDTLWATEKDIFTFSVLHFNEVVTRKKNIFNDRLRKCGVESDTSTYLYYGYSVVQFVYSYSE